MKPQFQFTSLNIFFVLLLIAAVNLIAGAFHFRWDVTQEGLYSLSKGSEKLLEHLEKPVTLKFYFSKDATQVPLQYKNYGRKVAELLREYQALAPGKIIVEQVNPKPDSDAEEWANRYQLTGAEMGAGESFYLGLVALLEDQEAVLPFLDPRREEYLEYDISQLITQVTRKGGKRLGLLSSLPLLGSVPDPVSRAQGQRGQAPWAVIHELEKSFEILDLDLASPSLPPDLSLLWVVHPKGLSEAAQYAIDQYLMSGGKLILSLDPSAKIDQVAKFAQKLGRRGNAASDLPKLLQAWGVEYDSHKILGDPLRPARVQASGLGVVPFYLWQQLGKEAFNQELIATKGLKNGLFIEPGSFRLKQDSPLELIPLITASAEAGLIESYLIPFTPVMGLNKRVKADGKRHYLAGLLKGKFKSAFEGPLDGEGEFIAQSKPGAQVFLLTDVDFLSDPFAVERIQLLGQVIAQARNDNLAFFVNLVDFLGGAEELLEIRARGRFQRPFTHFEELSLKAQTRYQEAQTRLESKLNDLQGKLRSLSQSDAEVQPSLSKEQLEKIQDFHQEEKKTRSELREIRKLLRQDIESSTNGLIWLNLLFMPFLLVIAGAMLYLYRFGKFKKAK